MIVHLSQEQLANVTNTSAPSATISSSNILSDIIQASGIMPANDSEIVEDADKDAVMQEDEIESPVVGNDSTNSERFFSSSKYECNNTGLTDHQSSTFQKSLTSSRDKEMAISCGRSNIQ